MSEAAAHARFERLVARALIAADPVAALRRAAADKRLTPPLRRRLAGLRPEGVELTALLVRKLRFERLLDGSTEAGRWFEADGADFVAAFARYHQEVPPTAFSPGAEARLFYRWLGRAVSSSARGASSAGRRSKRRPA